MSFKLELSCNDLELLTECLPIGILMHRKDRVVFANSALLAMLGYDDRKEVMGKSPLSLVHPDDRATVLARMRNNDTGQVNPPLEERLLRKDGSAAFGQVSGIPVALDGDYTILVIIKDLSGEKAAVKAAEDSRKRQAKLEENLRQAQKMEAIGQLAGGVAHDFNNILMVINMNCELMIEERGPRNGGPCDRLEEVLAAGESAVELTRQLLTFSRREKTERIHLNLNERVHSTRKMLSRLLQENIVSTLDLAPDLGWINADAGQIDQILLNLCVNARDAMPEGGSLALRTANVSVEPGTEAELLDLRLGAYVKLTVQDSGSGMTEAVRERIFEPFFTTKELGKGTGMGLATVYGIVVQNEASIGVESEPGAGSQFDIYFPRVDAPIENLGAASGGKAAPGHERILLVEDESALRNIVAQALKDQGYQVMEAGNAAEALELASKLKQPVDAMISDLIMPGMDGLKLAKQMRQKYGLKRVLLMSGYAYPVLSTLADDLPQENILQKPMSLAKMLGRLRELLDGPA